MMKKLIDRTESVVRFSEVDAMKVIWHGNYVKYLEDGRESFGQTFDLDYLRIAEEGFVDPIVNMNIDYKQFVKYGDSVIIETEYVNLPAAKLMFKYRIYRKSDHVLAAEATTTQVFLDNEGQLQLTNPSFFLDWKVKQGLLEKA